MIFGSVNLEDYVVVEYIRRPFLPTMEVHSTPIPGLFGNSFQKRTIGDIQIEVDVRIIEESRLAAQNVARTLAGLMAVPKPMKLYLRDEPGKFNMAILEGDMDYEKFLHTGFVTLTFTCNDPTLYDDVITTYTNAQGTTKLNSGSLPTPPIITIRNAGTGTDLKITETSTGDFVHITDTIINTDVIVFDMVRGSVRKNDILIMDKVSILSDFFPILPGNFRINTTRGTMTISFRRRWI